MGLSFIADYDSERVCQWSVFLSSVRLHFHSEWFSVILRSNAHELLAFVYIFVECTLPWQSPIANRVLHKHQRKLIDVIDREVKIFLTTYFRTTPMADVNFTSLSLVTSLITCHHCISFMVALVICKLQRILKGFTSLAAHTASVLFDDADNATCKSRVGLPYSVYSVLPVAQQTIFGFGCERTIGAWIHAFNTTMQYRFVLHCCDVMAFIVYCIIN